MGALGGIATQVLPLYGVILLGWLIGGRLPSLSRWFSRVLVYGLIPIVVLHNVTQADLAQIAVIPPILFLTAATMSLPARWMAQRLGDDFDPRLLSACFSFFNVAFFGIPVTTALFGEAEVSTIICAYIGSALYGDTIGYYLIARTKEGSRKAAMQALRVPIFYAFILALILRLNEVTTPEPLEPVASAISTLVSVLGMAVIGLNLAQVKAGETDWRVIGKILAVRQLCAAALLGTLLVAEALLLGLLATQDRTIIGMIALFPIAANVSLFASLLDTRKRDAALLVAASSLLSLALVTAVVALFSDMLSAGSG